MQPETHFAKGKTMNKMQKIACLIGMMILPMSLAVAALDKATTLLIAAIYFILRFAYLRHSLRLHHNNQITWFTILCNFFLLFVDFFFLALTYLTVSSFREEVEKRQSQNTTTKKQIILLNQAQQIAGITMPAGTVLETDTNIKRTQSDPNRFIYAEFPKPVIWHGIPIKSITRQLYLNQKWANDPMIKTQPAQTMAIGKWLCDELKWQFQQESVNKIPYTQSAEPYVYLHTCFLKQGQTVSLPVFQTTFSVKSIERPNDTFTGVKQGLWLATLSRNPDHSQNDDMDFYPFNVMVDSNQVIHYFFIELKNAPDKYCGLPEGTLLAWRKSEPDVIQVVSNPQYIPQACWGKKLQVVSVDEMQKILPQYDSYHFKYAKRRFKQTSTQ